MIGILPQINRTVKFIKTNLMSYTENATSTNLSEIQDWISDTCIIDKYHNNLKKEQKVFTLLSSGKTKMINSLFHLPKIICSEINSVHVLPNMVLLSEFN